MRLWIDGRRARIPDCTELILAAEQAFVTLGLNPGELHRFLPDGRRAWQATGPDGQALDWRLPAAGDVTLRRVES